MVVSAISLARSCIRGTSAACLVQPPRGAPANTQRPPAPRSLTFTGRSARLPVPVRLGPTQIVGQRSSGEFGESAQSVVDGVAMTMQLIGRRRDGLTELQPGVDRGEKRFTAVVGQLEDRPRVAVTTDGAPSETVLRAAGACSGPSHTNRTHNQRWGHKRTATRSFLWSG